MRSSFWSNLGFLRLLTCQFLKCFLELNGVSMNSSTRPTKHFVITCLFLVLVFSFFVFFCWGGGVVVVWVLEGLGWGEVAHRATSHHLNLPWVCFSLFLCFLFCLCLGFFVCFNVCVFLVFVVVREKQFSAILKGFGSFFSQILFFECLSVLASSSFLLNIPFIFALLSLLTCSSFSSSSSSSSVSSLSIVHFLSAPDDFSFFPFYFSICLSSFAFCFVVSYFEKYVFPNPFLNPPPFLKLMLVSFFGLCICSYLIFASCLLLLKKCPS